MRTLNFNSLIVEFLEINIWLLLFLSKNFLTRIFVYVIKFSICKKKNSTL